MPKKRASDFSEDWSKSGATSWPANTVFHGGGPMTTGTVAVLLTGQAYGNPGGKCARKKDSAFEMNNGGNFQTPSPASGRELRGMADPILSVSFTGPISVHQVKAKIPSRIRHNQARFHYPTSFNSYPLGSTTSSDTPIAKYLYLAPLIQALASASLSGSLGSMRYPVPILVSSSDELSTRSFDSPVHIFILHLFTLFEARALIVAIPRILEV
ncbi:hypothetical protein NLI96_g8763 [Meripilus lineatus]|uniref:Uncharacterized protein n=1 Tax=Meripilus lineatus TaxID=2056292 RepID=A0AAD5YBQ2_9APHY|nr:hypothetical protein NLI96_g8763 [Physisporinus lineatus]